MTLEEVQELVPGDWLSIKYGSNYIPFYVLKNSKMKEQILAGHPGWMVSHSEIFTYNNLTNPGIHYGDVVKLGNTKQRWWWKYLPWIIKDLFCPFIPLYQNKLKWMLEKYDA